MTESTMKFANAFPWSSFSCARRTLLRMHNVFKLNGRRPSTARHLHMVATSPSNVFDMDVDRFSQLSKNKEEPVLMKSGRNGLDSDAMRASFPALRKWFHVDKDCSVELALREHSLLSFPYELTITSKEDVAILRQFVRYLQSSDEISSTRVDQVWELLSPKSNDSYAAIGFHTFTASLQLLLSAIDFNSQQISPSSRLKRLYIAQSPISDLPKSLQLDVPAPDLLYKIGKGDVYGHSVWLGLEPTYTSFHRDPNPNLFIQACGSKIVRFLPPRLGDACYQQVQTRLHQQGNSRIRKTEMMHGPEWELFREIVWGAAAGAAKSPFLEAELQAGDSVYIPKGWWHSVRSVGEEGKLNASVNWWFR